MFPVNMPAPIQKCFGYGQVRLLKPVCSQNQPESYARSSFPYSVQFHSSKEDPDHNVQKQYMDTICIASSGLGRMHLVWKQASVQESFGPGSGRMQLLMGLQHFLLFTWMHSCTDGPDHNVQNWPRSNLVLADCVRYGPNGSSSEEAGVQKSLVPLLANAFELVWTGCESVPACLMVYLIKLGEIISNSDTDFFYF